MSNKIVSSGASGSSNLQSNDSTRIMSFTGDEDIEATIQCGRKLTIQSSQIMNVAM
jgi:hypothetical protein